MQNIEQPVRPNRGIDTWPSYLASHGNSAARILLDIYGDVGIINNVALTQLICDGQFSFAATETCQSNITNERHRDVSVAVHPTVLRKIRGAINRNLDLITGSNHERRTIVLRSSLLF